MEAVYTIGDPSEPSHQEHLFSECREDIGKNGNATVSIGDRPFVIGNNFLNDLKKHSTVNVLKKLSKALLIIHSPQDGIVEIKNATEIYNSAFRPKSFISLNGADHFLIHQTDAVYASSVLGAWVRRYSSEEKDDEFTTENCTAEQLGTDDFTTEIIVN